MVAVDSRTPAQLGEPVQELLRSSVRFEFGAEKLEWLEGVDSLVASPGVPPSNPLIRNAAERGIEVLSEIELAYRFLEVPLVAITGTNGKSTTTHLVGEILAEAGIRSFVGGNVGTPLIEFVGGSWDWGVVEVSSFQLERVREFRPRIALLLNLTEDHLDRYHDFAAYGEAKARLFAAQRNTDVGVLNRDDPLVWSLREKIPGLVFSFGWSEVDEGVFATEDEILWRGGHEEERFSTARVKIKGVHNVENLMAGIAASKAVGVAAPVIQRVIERFAGLEHRLEFVREIQNVRYYNDSKATNVGAVEKSIASFSSPIVWIAGGVDKQGSYDALKPLVRDKVKKLIVFGAARERIRSEFASLTDTALVGDLKAAVREAREAAREGDVVLLSPACSSFDMFENYMERGRAFKTLVMDL